MPPRPYRQRPPSTANAIADQQEAAQAFADEATAFKRDYEENTRSSIELGEVSAPHTPSKGERQAMARMQGYEGEACPECQNFTLVRNGTCMKCDSLRLNHRLQLAARRQSGKAASNPHETEKQNASPRVGVFFMP